MHHEATQSVNWTATSLLLCLLSLLFRPDQTPLPPSSCHSFPGIKSFHSLIHPLLHDFSFLCQIFTPRQGMLCTLHLFLCALFTDPLLPLQTTPPTSLYSQLFCPTSQLHRTPLQPMHLASCCTLHTVLGVVLVRAVKINPVLGKFAAGQSFPSPGFPFCNTNPFDVVEAHGCSMRCKLMVVCMHVALKVFVTC